MIVPFLLFVVAIAGVGVAFALPGMTDLLLLAGPAAVASLVLLVLAARRPVRRRGFEPTSRPPRGSVFRRTPTVQPKYIMVDGSNVIHWKDGLPQIATLREVVGHLVALGFTPGVVFDANVGYKIADRYQHDWALSRLLGLPAEMVMVVDKGTPADPVLLAAARDLGTQIVTNDRYRDWATDHPAASAPGNLIRGGFRDGKLWLDLNP